MITIEQINKLKELYMITNNTDRTWLEIFEFEDEISVQNNPLKARDALLKCLAFFIKKDGHIMGFYIFPSILLTQFKMIQTQLLKNYESSQQNQDKLMLYSYNHANFGPAAFNSFLSQRTQLLSALEYYKTNPPTPLNEQPFKAFLTIAIHMGYKVDPQDPVASIDQQIVAEKTKKNSLK